MSKAFRFPAFLLAVLLVASFLGPPLGLSQVTPTMPSPAPTSWIDPGLLDFIKVFGFGAMIFLVWWGDAKKIDKLTALITNYETLTKNYEGVVAESRDTMLMTMQINTRMTEKLEYLLKERGIPP